MSSAALLWRGLAALLVGAVVLAIGVGLGPPHLAKDGPLVVTVMGLLLLASGATVAITGVVALMRSTRGWRRLPIVPSAFVIVAVGLLTIGQAVAATNVPRTEVGGSTPEDHGHTYEEVRFSTDDGVQLSGWYVPSRSGAAVVVLHGAGSTRSGVLEEAIVLADHGYGVLLYDARGHGRSGGRAMDFGWYGDLDVAAAVSFLSEQPNVEWGGIGLLGSSMGGEQAVGAIAHDDRVAAVVAEGVTNRVATDKAWLSDQFGVPGWVQEQLDRVTYGIADLLTPAGPPTPLRSAVSSTATPVLLIAAGRVDTEQHAARFIRSGSADTVETWTVPGSGHTGGLATDPEGWKARVLGFFDRHLATASRPHRS